MKTIGLIGGMSWESSAIYYQIINRRTRDILGGSHSARSLMYSVDFADIAALQHVGDWDKLEVLMIDAAQRLEKGGADCVVICTNTMHILADKVEQAVDIPLIHIGDAVGESIQQTGIKKAGLFGTKFTMEKRFMSDRLARHGVETFIPGDEDRDLIHNVIYNELVRGEINDHSREEVLAAISKTITAGAEAIILGCTELPLLVTEEHTSIPLFDTTTIHAEKAVEWALG